MVWLLDIETPLRKQPQMEWRPNNVYAETLVVAMDYDYPPYSFLDAAGIPSGFDVELAYALADKMQVNVELLLLPWSDARKALLDGRAHLLTGLERIAENIPAFELSVPLHNDPYVAFGAVPLNGISDLYGKRMAVLADSASYFSILKPYLMDSNLSHYKTYSEAFESVLRGENEYAVSRFTVGRRILAEQGNHSLQVAMELPNNYLCIGAKGGNTALIQRVNTALIALSRDGIRDKLSQKWLDRYVRLITWKDVIHVYAVEFILAGCGVILLVMTGVGLYRFRAVRHRQTTMERMLEHQNLIAETTRGLYENILEMDITHNRAGNEVTRRYFESLGLPGDCTYVEAMRAVAQTRIAEEHSRQFLDTFSPEALLQAYAEGKRSLTCELRAKGLMYQWMRISTRIFFLHHDNSVRILAFYQNIDEEKHRELILAEQASQDSLTGLYNKAATERLVNEALQSQSLPPSQLAFFIFDIDNFKRVNDTLGHAVGDEVLLDFALELKRQFRSGDIVGRIGGDEFVACISSAGKSWTEKKAAELVNKLRMSKLVQHGTEEWHVSISMGIALAPSGGTSFQELYRNADKALYQTKQRGKDGFTVFEPDSARDVPSP